MTLWVRVMGIKRDHAVWGVLFLLSAVCGIISERLKLFNDLLSLVFDGFSVCGILSLWIKRDYAVWGMLFLFSVLCGITIERLLTVWA